MKIGLKAERQVAKLEHGQVTPASGARWHSKEDVVSRTRLTQVKATTKKSYTLKLKDLETVAKNAAAADLEPVFIVDFVTPAGSKRYQITPYYGVSDE